MLVVRESHQRITRKYTVAHLGAPLLCALLAACVPAAQAFRLNPEQTPEQYRITCKKRFLNCEQQIKPLCGSDYQIIERHSNMPEQPLVRDSDLSSTGPKSGPVDWAGELVVVCGRILPPLHLTRAEQAPEVSSSPSTNPPAGALVATERVCVPGVTQACLGPGACSGAQACLESATGYGPCDCGPAPQRLPAAAGTGP
jgi:hypothetical protein